MKSIAVLVPGLSWQAPDNRSRSSGSTDLEDRLEAVEGLSLPLRCEQNLFDWSKLQKSSSFEDFL